MASEAMPPDYERKTDNRVNGKIKPDQSHFTIDLSIGIVTCNKCKSVGKVNLPLNKDTYGSVEDFKAKHSGCRSL